MGISGGKQAIAVRSISTAVMLRATTWWRCPGRSLQLPVRGSCSSGFDMKKQKKKYAPLNRYLLILFQRAAHDLATSSIRSRLAVTCALGFELVRTVSRRQAGLLRQAFRMDFCYRRGPGKDACTRVSTYNMSCVTQHSRGLFPPVQSSH